MKKGSLQTKILVPIIVLVVAIMAVSTAITYFLSSRAFKEDAISSLAMTAQDKADLIDVWVEDARGMIASSTNRTVFEDVLQNDSDDTRSKANAALSELIGHLGVFSYINIANAQGEVRASTIPDSIGKVKVPDRQYFQKAMQGEINVSTVYLARTTGKPAFAIAAPIKSGGTVIGVLFGVPDLTKFSEKFVDPVKYFNRRDVGNLQPQVFCNTLPGLFTQRVANAFFETYFDSVRHEFTLIYPIF